MAEEDKEKQDKAIADYLAEHPPKDDDDDDSDDEEKPKKKAHRQKKDPNAPKNAMNAFLYWSKEQRPVLKAANPDATFQDFVRFYLIVLMLQTCGKTLTFPFHFP